MATEWLTMGLLWCSEGLFRCCWESSGVCC